MSQYPLETPSHATIAPPSGSTSLTPACAAGKRATRRRATKQQQLATIANGEVVVTVMYGSQIDSFLLWSGGGGELLQFLWFCLPRLSETTKPFFGCRKKKRKGRKGKKKDYLKSQMTR
jgi:hypothetical protein